MTTRSKSWRSLLSAALPAVIFLGLALSARAQNVWQASGTASWNVPGNWADNSVPGPGTFALISNGGTATIGVGVSATARNVLLGRGSGGTLLINGGYLKTIWVGTLGQSFGGVGVGTVTVSNGGVWDAGGAGLPGFPAEIEVGAGGAAGFLNILAGGTVNANSVKVGDTGGGMGTLTMTGGNLNVFETENSVIWVGYENPGLYQQSGGQATLRQMTVGSGPGVTGTATVSGGTMDTVLLNIGDKGNGTFTQTGGLVRVSFAVNFGIQSGTGTLNLSGGVFEAPAFQEITADGSGKVIFNSGTLRISGTSDNANLFGSFEDNDVTINAGGGTIDTNGHSVGIQQGMNGVGRLTKTGAGVLTLTGFNGYTGGTTVQSGTLVLTGSGNYIIHGNASMIVGQNGGDNAELRILDQAAAFSENSVIGFNGGSQGRVVLTAGSWLDFGSISIGESGTGTLTLNSGFAAATGHIWLGSGFSGVGAVTVFGGTMQANDEIAVGYQGAGTMGLEGGLLLAKSNFRVGASTNGVGLVTVGTGGTLRSEADIYVGDAGAGTMTINGLVSASGSTSTVYVGNGVTGTGGVTVNTGGTLSMNAAVLVGFSGKGGLVVDGGYVSSVGAGLGIASSGSGQVTVNSGTWLNTGDATIGAQGRGSLIVNGGLATVTGTTVIGAAPGSGGVLTLTNASGTAGVFSTLKVRKGGNSGGSVLFEGGILRALGDDAAFVTNFANGALVSGSGGATIDDNGYTIGIASGFAGGGGLTKVGSGTLTLGGLNTYTGSTTVQAGKFIFNGTNTGGGAMTVQSGATLGGTGNFSGAVTIANGGILSPGNSPGTITVGSMILNSTSDVRFELGTVSDLVVVTNAGGLTLDGLLTVTGGAGFGLGTYTLFQYNGPLTNNGLSFASLPAGYLYTLDFSQAGKVNLVVEIGDYWDGSNTTPDGTVNGGSGTWNNNPLNTNWTVESGTMNFAWGGSNQAIFTGSAGTVNVADTVNVAKMTFVTDGYALTGTGALAISGSTLTVNVVSGVDATIGTTITGSGALVKVGSDSTLILTGSNNYTRGTIVKSGTLAVSGTGASINHSLGAMIVGDTAGDNGTLLLVNGGYVSSGTGLIGNAANSAGAVIVAGGTWSHGGLYVGNSGTGSLGINGGYVTGSTSYLGAAATGFGSATVTSGTWENTDTLFVGFSGTGSLLINGGVVFDNMGLVANNVGSSGTVTVSSGRWTNTSSLYVGVSGTGVLNITGGLVEGGPFTYIGAYADSNGTVNVSGGTLVTGDNFGIGSHGTGTLLINGGVVTSQGGVGLAQDDTASGVATVQSGTWTVARRLIVGQFGQGTLLINGGLVTSGSGVIGWGPFLDGPVTGTTRGNGIATVNGGTWTNSQEMIVGYFGTGTLVMNGGLVTSATSGFIGYQSGTFGGPGSYGIATVNGGTWANVNNLYIGNSGTGILTVSGSGLVSSATTRVAENAGSVGTLNLNGGMLLTGEVSSGSGSAAFSFSGGTLRATGSNANFINGFASGVITGPDWATIDSNGFDVGTAVSFTGSGLLAKIGQGKLTLTGSSNLTGGVRVTTGTLAVQGGVINGPGASMLVGEKDGDNATLVISNGGLVSMGQAWLGFFGGQARVLVSNGTWNNSGNLTMNGGGPVDATVLEIDNGGLVTNAHAFLAQSATSSSTVSVKSGTWATSGTAVVGVSGRATVNLTGGKMSAQEIRLAQNAGASGVLNVGTGSTAGVLEATSIVGGSGTATVNFNHTDAVTLASNLSGSLAVNKLNSGTTTLTGSSSYTRGTALSGGVLLAGNNAALSSGTVTISNGATLGATGTARTLANNVLLQGDAMFQSGTAIGSNFTLNGTMNLGGTARTLSFAPGLLTAVSFGGVISNDNGAGLTLQRSGTSGAAFALFSGSDSNTYTGTTRVGNGMSLTLTKDGTATAIAGDLVVDTGGSVQIIPSLLVTDVNQIADTARVDLNGTGQLQLGGTGATKETISSLWGNGRLTLGSSYSGNLVLSSGSFAGVISGTNSSNELTKTGTGTLVLSGTNTMRGALRVEGGILAVYSNTNMGGATPTLAGGALQARASFASGKFINLSTGGGTLLVTTSNTLTLTGRINEGLGSQNLTIGDVSNAGALVFNGTATHTGATTLASGTLSMNGLFSGTSAVTVKNHAALMGTGTFAGRVTVENGGILAPGNSPGTLTVGEMILNDTSDVRFELGTTSDLVVVTNAGGLTLDGILNVTDGGGFAPGSYTLFQYNGALTDHGLTLGTLPAGYFYTLDLSQSGYVKLTVAPPEEYWDGTNTIPDGTVHGGDGTWNNDPLNTNWTTSSGSSNFAWNSSGTAIFSGSAGTVNVAETINVKDIVFETTGYALTGTGALAISGTSLTVKTGTGITATIASTITGSGALVKTGTDGTLVLTGSNNYSGDPNGFGTTIRSGTLAVNGGSINHELAEMMVGWQSGDSGALLIVNGGAVNADDSFLGYVGGAKGTALVDNGTWNNAGDLVVGQGGTGTLTVQNGGLVSDSNGYVGGNPGGVGTALVSGGTWNTSNTLYVGALGTGTLTIENGGLVTSKFGHIGEATGVAGTVNVTSGTWAISNSSTVANSLFVGVSGIGTLNIGNGAVVTNAAASVGDQVTGHGTVNVNGGTWTSASFITVGNTGTGTLNITGGGTVSDGLAFVGFGGLGEVLVDNSTWTNNHIVLGEFGAGTVTFQNGGTISASGTLLIADNDGATGTLNLGAADLLAPTTVGVFNAPLVVFGDGDGVINFNQTNTLAFAGKILGQGTINQRGSGTTTMSGTSSYTGTTKISAGTLRTVGLTALGQSDIVLTGGALAPTGQLNVASLDWNGGTVMSTLGSATSLLNITGSMALTGTGTFAFTPDGGFAGNTAYNILNAANLGDFNIAEFTGNLLDGITPTFTIEGGQLFVNFIGASTGPLLQNSGPVWTPTNADFLVNGVVKTGTPSQSNMVNSLIFNPNSSLQVFNNLTVTSGKFTVGSGVANLFGGNVITPGDFNKLGAGKLITNTNLLVGGAANVQQGALIVNGQLTANGGLTVVQGALLGGDGVINGNVFNRGTVSPGNSPGTLTFVGNYVQSSSATLLVEIASLSVFDRLIVTGNASLAGTLQVSAGKLKYGQQYAFLQAGSISGDFDQILMPQPNKFRGRFLTEGGTGILLVAPTSYTLVAETTNQQNVAKALDSYIPAKSGDRLAVSTALDLLTSEQYPSAFDQIAPTFYESLADITIEQINAQNQMLVQRLGSLRLGAAGFQAIGIESPLVHDKDGKSVMDAKDGKDIITPGPDNKWGVFAMGNGIFAKVSPVNQLPNYHFEGGGFIAGLDYRWNENLATGVYVGYQGSYAKYDGGSTTSINGVNFGGYATYQNGGFYADAIVGGGYNGYDVRRTIEFSNINRTARSNPGGGNLTTYLNLGYDWQAGNFTFGPILGGQYTYAGIGSFTESNADSLNLKVGQQNANSLRMTLGGHVAYTWKLNEHIVLIPEIRMFWQHEFLENPRNISSALDSGNGPTFGYQTSAPDRDAVFAGAGITAQFGKDWNAFFFYNIDFGRQDYLGNYISGGLTWKF